MSNAQELTDDDNVYYLIGEQANQILETDGLNALIEQVGDVSFGWYQCNRATASCAVFTDDELKAQGFNEVEPKDFKRLEDAAVTAWC